MNKNDEKISIIQEAGSNLSKAEITISNAAYLVEEGLLNPIDAAIFLTRVKKVVEQALKTVEGYGTVEEALKYGKYFERHGMSVTVKGSGTRYKFNSQTYLDLKARLKAREELEKTALEASKQGTEVFDPETGEVVPPAIEILGGDIVVIAYPKK